MERIDISSIKPGIRFSKPVFFDDGKYMFIESGISIKPYHLAALSKWRIPFLLSDGHILAENEEIDEDSEQLLEDLDSVEEIQDVTDEIQDLQSENSTENLNDELAPVEMLESDLEPIEVLDNQVDFLEEL